MEFTIEEADDQIENLIRQGNSPIYRNNPRHFMLEPHRVYFYYVTDPYLKPEPYPPYYHYDHPMPIRNTAAARRIIDGLAQNAASGGSDPPIAGHGFNKEAWRRRSLIAILVDHKDWHFKPNSGIVFDPTKGHGNHTFFDGFDHEVEITNEAGVTRTRTCVGFFNYMVNERGDPLDHDIREEFHFWMYSLERGRVVREPVDPGGTNLGPPVPPP